MVGLKINEFWHMTPNEFMKYAKAYNKKKQDQIKEQDMLNWLLGKYIAYSFNEPRKYPTKPFLSHNTSYDMSNEEMEEVAKRNCMKLGGEIIDGR